jgi:hypothetical protein
MGLFDDPEMQLIGFEQSGINTAKHFAPQQDKMGLLHPPSFDIELDTLSGAPKRYIHWGPNGNNGGLSSSGEANVDPTMMKFFRKSQVPKYINLSPDQEPELRHQQWLRAMELYRDMTPEQIRQLHYTDAQSFPATSDSDLNHKARMSQEAYAFIERQKAIQEFRMENASAHQLASRLELLGGQQRLGAIANWGDERNSIYLANLKRYIKENPGLGDSLDAKGLTPEKFVRIYGVDSNQSLFIPDPDVMKQRRQTTIDLLDQWGKVTRKHGLTAERFTPGTPPRTPPKFPNVGGFLLGLAGFAGEIGMASRALMGGRLEEKDGQVDVYLPSELGPSPDERMKKLFQEGVIMNEDGSISI